MDATPSSSKSLHHPYPSISLQIYFNGQHTTIKMDSGAEANIVSKQTFNILQPQPTLSESKVKLKPYGSPPLPVLIQFSATLVANGHTIEHQVYVPSGPIQLTSSAGIPHSISPSYISQ